MFQYSWSFRLFISRELLCASTHSSEHLILLTLAIPDYLLWVGPDKGPSTQSGPLLPNLTILETTEWTTTLQPQPPCGRI